MMIWLKILGIFLSALLVSVLFLAAAVFFFPIRYSFRGHSGEDMPVQKLDSAFFKEKTDFVFRAEWACRFLSLDYLYSEEKAFTVRVLGIRIPADRLIQRKKSKKEKEVSSGKKGKFTLKKGYDTIKKVWRNISYYRTVWQSEMAEITREETAAVLRRLIPSVLPKKWNVTGEIGFEDPENTGKLMEVQGILYPLTAGHVIIFPWFSESDEKEKFFLSWDMKGRIYGIVLAVSFFRLVKSRAIRSFLYLVRKGPGKREGKGRAANC